MGEWMAASVHLSKRYCQYSKAKIALPRDCKVVVLLSLHIFCLLLIHRRRATRDMEYHGATHQPNNRNDVIRI
jgi:hypothetical protein